MAYELSVNKVFNKFNINPDIKERLITDIMHERIKYNKVIKQIKGLPITTTRRKKPRNISKTVAHQYNYPMTRRFKFAFNGGGYPKFWLTLYPPPYDPLYEGGKFTVVTLNYDKIIKYNDNRRQYHLDLIHSQEILTDEDWNDPTWRDADLDTFLKLVDQRVNYDVRQFRGWVEMVKRIRASEITEITSENKKVKKVFRRIVK